MKKDTNDDKKQEPRTMTLHQSQSHPYPPSRPSHSPNPSSFNRFLFLGFPTATPSVFTCLADGTSTGADHFREGATGGVDGRGTNGGLGNFVGNINGGPSIG